MPIEGNVMKRGSLFIQFSIEYPKYLSEEKLNALRNIFDIPVPQLPNSVEAYRLSEVSPEMFGNSVPDYNQSRNQNGAYCESSDSENERMNECQFQ